MLHPIPSLQVPLAMLRPTDVAKTRETLAVLFQNDYLNANPNPQSTRALRIYFYEVLAARLSLGWGRCKSKAPNERKLKLMLVLNFCMILDL